ncbi:MAG: hypothetical protein ACLU4S_12410 [Clostridium perfringens]
MEREDEIIELLNAIYRKLEEISENTDYIRNCKNELDDIEFAVNGIKNNM